MRIPAANTSNIHHTHNTRQPASPAPAKAGTTTGDADASTPAAQDKVSLSSSSPAKLTDATYADPRLAKPTQSSDLRAMLEESDRKAQQIIDLIRPLIEQQGLNLSKVVSGEQKLSADPATIAAAKDAISEDGEFGVRKTAERILSFAKGSIGDDPGKLDAVRAAVEKGFKEASDILGGSLPEISQQTLKAIQAEFERWKADGIPSGNTVSLAKEPAAAPAVAPAATA
ncbi:MAG: hypothetical protein V4488_24985 [Pseudomonadota bacterium]